MPNTLTKSDYPYSLNTPRPFEQAEQEVQDSPSSVVRSNLLLPLALVFVFVAALVWRAATVPSFPLERVPYQVILFTLCSWSYFLFRRSHALRLIAFFMPLYYVLFGAAEFLTFYAPSEYAVYESAAFVKKSFLSDALIIMGASSVLAGAALALPFLPKRTVGWFSLDWKPAATYWLAIFCWSVGFVATIFVQIIYEAWGRTVGLESHLISNAIYLAPLGGGMLIYLTFREGRQPLLWASLILVMISEYILGFVGNSKEISYRLPVLFILSGFFLKGSFNKKLIVLVVLSFIPFLALFNAYRTDVLQVRRQSGLQAIESRETSEEIVRRALNREKALPGKNAFLALDRVDCRKYIDLITSKVGDEVPYLHGQTIIALLYTFIPKILWLDKPELLLGQLMNRTFRLSASPKTFVPTTQLGELYWNFGWEGGMAGMFIMGVLLAVIGQYCALGSGSTAAGFLVVLVTAYLFGMRFEGAIAVAYSELIRMTFMIFVLDKTMRFLGATTPLPDGRT